VVYDCRLGYSIIGVMAMLEILMLALLVIVATSLIITGVIKDRKKIKKEVKLMIQPLKHYVKCSSCRRWVSLGSSNMFEGLGIFCLNCSKQLLTPSTQPITIPVVVDKKKERGFLMRMVKGSEDEY